MSSDDSDFDINEVETESEDAWTSKSEENDEEEMETPQNRAPLTLLHHFSFL